MKFIIFTLLVFLFIGIVIAFIKGIKEKKELDTRFENERKKLERLNDVENSINNWLKNRV